MIRRALYIHLARYGPPTSSTTMPAIASSTFRTSRGCFITPMAQNRNTPRKETKGHMTHRRLSQPGMMPNDPTNDVIKRERTAATKDQKQIRIAVRMLSAGSGGKRQKWHEEQQDKEGSKQHAAN